MSDLDNVKPSTSVQNNASENQSSTELSSNTTITLENELAGASAENDIEKLMDQAVTVEEFLQKSKTLLLNYEKHMFLDMIDTDGLVVCAK